MIIIFGLHECDIPSLFLNDFLPQKYLYYRETYVI